MNNFILILVDYIKSSDIFSFMAIVVSFIVCVCVCFLSQLMPEFGF